jgi:hypothetical protein
MTMSLAFILTPPLFVAQVILILALLFAVITVYFGFNTQGAVNDVRRYLKKEHAFVEAERDIALDMGIEFRTWMTARLILFLVLTVIAVFTGIILLMLVAVVTSIFGFRWLLSMRAAKRRLNRERAWIDLLRNLQERMSSGNQSLDIALGELAQRPPSELAYIMAPLGAGGSMIARLVAIGKRSRSPVIEGSIALLILSRSRSQTMLVDAIHDVLIPVGRAQIEIQAEAMVTLSTQRAVSIAMILLMLFMLAAALRADAFRIFYHTLAGQFTLLAVFTMFSGLLWLVTKIVRTPKVTRWDLDQVAVVQQRLGS